MLTINDPGRKERLAHGLHFTLYTIFTENKMNYYLSSVDDTSRETRIAKNVVYLSVVSLFVWPVTWSTSTALRVPENSEQLAYYSTNTDFDLKT